MIRPIKDGVDRGVPKQAIVSLNMKVRPEQRSNLTQAIVKLDMKVGHSGNFRDLFLVSMIHKPHIVDRVFTLQDWKDMCNAYNVEESDVPHRQHGKVAKKEKKNRKSNEN